MNLVDPEGRKVYIAYLDSEGNNQKIEYTAGMTYDGDENFVSELVGLLNDMYLYGGDQVLDTLIGATNEYSFRNQSIEGQAGYHDGYLDVGAFLNSDNHYTYADQLEGIAHESFHALQHEEGQGGPSVNNEVEAYVFGSRIQLNYISDSFVFGSFSGKGRENVSGQEYEAAFKILLQGFNESALNSAIANFKTGSISNSGGLYTNFPNYPENYKASLLTKYYPSK